MFRIRIFHTGRKTTRIHIHDLPVSCPCGRCTRGCFPRRWLLQGASGSRRGSWSGSSRAGEAGSSTSSPSSPDSTSRLYSSTFGTRRPSMQVRALSCEATWQYPPAESSWLLALECLRWAGSITNGVPLVPTGNSFGRVRSEQIAVYAVYCIV